MGRQAVRHGSSYNMNWVMWIFQLLYLAGKFVRAGAGKEEEEKMAQKRRLLTNTPNGKITKNKENHKIFARFSPLPQLCCHRNLLLMELLQSER